MTDEQQADQELLAAIEAAQAPIWANHASNDAVDSEYGEFQLAIRS